MQPRLLKPYHLTLLASFVLAGLVFAPNAWAQAGTVETVFEGMGDAVNPLPKLMMAGSYMLGLVALIVGLMKLKDSVDDPGKNKIQSGVITLIVGVLLIALPKAIELGRSLTGAKTQPLSAPVTMGNFKGKISR